MSKETTRISRGFSCTVCSQFPVVEKTAFATKTSSGRQIVICSDCAHKMGSIADTLVISQQQIDNLGEKNENHKKRRSNI